MPLITHLVYLSALLSLLPFTLATIFSPRISTCRSSTASNVDPSSLINITQAWAQIFPPDRARELNLAGSEEDKNVLRINLLGETGKELVGFSNETGKLGECGGFWQSLITITQRLEPKSHLTLTCIRPPFSHPLPKDRRPHLQRLVHRHIPLQLPLPGLSTPLRLHPSEHDLLPPLPRSLGDQHLHPPFIPLRSIHLGKRIPNRRLERPAHRTRLHPILPLPLLPIRLVLVHDPLDPRGSSNRVLDLIMGRKVRGRLGRR